MKTKMRMILGTIVAGACLLVFATHNVVVDALTTLQVSASRWLESLPEEAVLLVPLYVLTGSAMLVIVLGSWRMAHSLDAICALQKQVCGMDRASHIDRRRASLTVQLSQPQGWAAVAGQLIADALQQTVSVNVSEAGVMDVAAMPAPRFTVCAVDGRRFTFTVNPGALRQHGLLPKSFHDVNLSVCSSLLATDAQMLWEALQSTSRSTPHTAVPRQTAWHIVVTHAHSVRFCQKTPLLESRTALRVRVLQTLHLL
jgi:hypothetical protein